MDDLDAPRRFLKKMIDEGGPDMKTLSDMIGRSHSYIQQYIKRGHPRVLADRDREIIGRALGINPDALRLEGDPMRSSDPKIVSHKGPTKIMPDQGEPDQIRVPEYDIAAAAGPGSLPIANAPADGLTAVDYWSLPRRFLEAFSQSAESLTVIRVTGDSMEPDYQAGERVLIDRSYRSPSPPGIYMLWDGIGLVLKRVEVVFGSSDPIMLRISSINPAYSTYERPLDEVQINGRVVGKWVWK